MSDGGPVDLTTGFGDPAERIASALVSGIERSSWDALELVIDVRYPGGPDGGRVLAFKFHVVDGGERIPLPPPRDACAAAGDWHSALIQAREHVWTSALVKVERNMTFTADLRYD